MMEGKRNDRIISVQSPVLVRSDLPLELTMHPVSPDTILEQLRWRYATKKFDPSRKIDAGLWAKLEEAPLLAPSSYGLQPWKFVVVTDPEMRKKLHPVSYQQPQILDASHLVVFAARKPPVAADVEQFVARTEELRGLAAGALDGLRKAILGFLAGKSEAEGFSWAARQTYIALGFFLAACALAGVDACPMEGFQPDQYDEILGLKAKGFGSVALATAGYRIADDRLASAAKSRFTAAEVIDRV
jgi:nitroreductase